MIICYNEREWRFEIQLILTRRNVGIENMYLAAGLGNPGRKYRMTRHNAGYLTVERLARRHRIELGSRKFNAVIGRGQLAGRRALLALPQTFMNLSGEAVAPLLGYFRAEPEDLIVIHDDVDLAGGRLKVKQGGGTGGHRGLSSLIDKIGSDRFCRVRIGIGRPDREELDTSDWVLTKFTQEELDALDGVLDEAADAVEALVVEEVEAVMNRFNAHSSTGN